MSPPSLSYVSLEKKPPLKTLLTLPRSLSLSHLLSHHCILISMHTLNDVFFVLFSILHYAISVSQRPPPPAHPPPPPPLPPHPTPDINYSGSDLEGKLENGSATITRAVRN